MESSNVIDYRILNDVLEDLRNRKNEIKIDDGFERRKEYLENECKKQQEQMKVIFFHNYNRKLVNLQKRNLLNKHIRAELNRQKIERVQNRLEVLRTQERIKNVELIKRIEGKAIKTRKLLADKERLRISEKQTKDVQRFNERVKRQNITLAENQLLIDKCLERDAYGEPEDNDQEAEQEEVFEDEPLEETNVEEECGIDWNQSVSENCRKFIPLVLNRPTAVINKDVGYVFGLGSIFFFFFFAQIVIF